MSTTPECQYWVDAESNPALLILNGRASYLNCGPVGRFFDKLIRDTESDIIIDFKGCTGMDSTFLGLIAGAAIELRKQTPPRSLTLCRLNERNLELIRNLGLHRILTVDAQDHDLSFDANKAAELSDEQKEKVATARTILQAHENLIQADAANQEKFQDVLTFLKMQVDNE